MNLTSMVSPSAVEFDRSADLSSCSDSARNELPGSLDHRPSMVSNTDCFWRDIEDREHLRVHLVHACRSIRIIVGSNTCRECDGNILNGHAVARR
jgi:hypothetical protein